MPTKKATATVLSSDVDRFVLRMEHAALDVLYNKAEWGARSNVRRNMVTALGGTTGIDGPLRFHRGREAMLAMHFRDQFEAYPLDLQTVMRAPPDHWWYEDGTTREPESQPIAIK